MRLVDGQQTDSTRDTLDALDKALVVKAFRSDVKDSQVGFTHAGVD